MGLQGRQQQRLQQARCDHTPPSCALCLLVSLSHACQSWPRRKEKGLRLQTVPRMWAVFFFAFLLFALRRPFHSNEQLPDSLGSKTTWAALMVAARSSNRWSPAATYKMVPSWSPGGPWWAWSLQSAGTSGQGTRAFIFSRSRPHVLLSSHPPHQATRLPAKTRGMDPSAASVDLRLAIALHRGIVAHSGSHGWHGWRFWARGRRGRGK